MMLNITADFWPYNPVKACHLYQKSLKCQPASQPDLLLFFSFFSSFLLTARTDGVRPLRQKSRVAKKSWSFIMFLTLCTSWKICFADLCASKDLVDDISPFQQISTVTAEHSFTNIHEYFFQSPSRFWI